MKLSDLRESIDTSGLYRSALAALREKMLDAIRDIYADLKIRIDSPKDRWQDSFVGDGDYLIRRLMPVVSKTLKQVVAANVETTFKDDPRMQDGEDSSGKVNRWFVVGDEEDSGGVDLENIHVNVLDKLYTKEPAKGFFTTHVDNMNFPGSNGEGVGIAIKAKKEFWVKSIIQALHSFWELHYEKKFSKEEIWEDNYLEMPKEQVDRMIKSIMSTFVHEYVHLEQYLRGKHNSDRNDLSYIRGKRSPGEYTRSRLRDKEGNALISRKTGKSIEVKKRINPRHGKRGGYARTPSLGDREESRYYGRTHELDSFSSGAAAELIQSNVNTRSGEPGSYWNSEIQRLQDELRRGGQGVDMSSLNHYYVWYKKHLRQTLDQDLRQRYRIPLTDLANNRKQRELYKAQLHKVWRKFLKSVYLKLEHYKKPEPPRRRDRVRYRRTPSGGHLP